MGELKVLDIYNRTPDSIIEKFNDKVDSTLNVVDDYEEYTTDTEWIDIMEDTIKYIDNIFDDRVKEFTKELKKNNITEYNDKELNKKDLVLATGENMDNFFELGGDSIKGMQIVSLLRQKGYALRLSDLFTWPTAARRSAPRYRPTTAVSTKL